MKSKRTRAAGTGRRQFLTATAAAAGGILLAGSRPISAQTHGQSTGPGTGLPEPLASTVRRYGAEFGEFGRNT